MKGLVDVVTGQPQGFLGEAEGELQGHDRQGLHPHVLREEAPVPDQGGGGLRVHLPEPLGGDAGADRADERRDVPAERPPRGSGGVAYGHHEEHQGPLPHQLRPGAARSAADGVRARLDGLPACDALLHGDVVGAPAQPADHGHRLHDRRGQGDGALPPQDYHSGSRRRLTPHARVHHRSVRRPRHGRGDQAHLHRPVRSGRADPHHPVQGAGERLHREEAGEDEPGWGAEGGAGGVDAHQADAATGYLDDVRDGDGGAVHRYLPGGRQDGDHLHLRLDRCGGTRRGHLPLHPRREDRGDVREEEDRLRGPPNRHRIQNGAGADPGLPPHIADRLQSPRLRGGVSLHGVRRLWSGDHPPGDQGELDGGKEHGHRGDGGVHPCAGWAGLERGAGLPDVAAGAPVDPGWAPHHGLPFGEALKRRHGVAQCPGGLSPSTWTRAHLLTLLRKTFLKMFLSLKEIAVMLVGNILLNKD